MEYVIEEFPGHIKCFARLADENICKCQIGIEKGVWTISAWFTKEEYKHQGIGKETMQYILRYMFETFGAPEEIDYIWNGTNQYVYDWIHNCFDAYCKCPIAIQKTQSDDDWSSHVYVLNHQKIFQYFKI